MKKSSLINRFFGKVKSALSADEEEQLLTADSEQKNEHFDNSQPLDVNFAKQFTQRGGSFIYCADQQAVNAYIAQLMEENQWENCYCDNSELKKVLDTLQLKYQDNKLKEANVIVSNCEYLIAFNGSVMISSKQSNNKKIDILPENHIIVAYTSQIVKNLSEGLRGINIKYKSNIPSLITTIRNECERNKQTHSGPKNLYLLLIEDYQ